MGADRRHPSAALRMKNARYPVSMAASNRVAGVGGGRVALESRLLPLVGRPDPVHTQGSLSPMWV